MDNLLSDNELLHQTGIAAGDFVHKNAGATQKILSCWES
jgi:hypothetical protein